MWEAENHYTDVHCGKYSTHRSPNGWGTASGPKNEWSHMAERPPQHCLSLFHRWTQVSWTFPDASKHKISFQEPRLVDREHHATILKRSIYLSDSFWGQTLPDLALRRSPGWDNMEKECVPLLRQESYM